MKDYRITQIDLCIDKEEISAVKACLDRKWLTEGIEAENFKQSLEAYFKTGYVTFAPNGTLGLYLAILALDLEPGSEILVPNFTFYGSVTPIIFAGHIPVFVDINSNTLNADLKDFEAVLTSSTKAIMPVHIYGQCSNIAEICEWAKNNNLKIIEDAAQAMGVKYQQKPLGTYGDISVFSLFSDKIITSGEGGVVLVSEKKMYDKILLLRNQGRSSSGSFEHQELGMNFRITDMQAAIAFEQFKKISHIRADRKKKWQQYINGLTGVGDIQFMTIESGCDFIPFRFPILTNYRDELMKHLEMSAIQTRGMFMPMNMQRKLKRYSRTKLSKSRDVWQRGICLPIHIGLNESDIEYVISILKKFYN